MKKLPVFLIVTLSSFNLFSQTEEIKDSTAKNLNAVEIVATKEEIKTQLYTPSSVVKLKETELKRSLGLFFDDAINTNVPGVYMERRTTSAGQQFNIRGYGNGARGTNGVNSNFDGQGYKVYLNGIPITDAEGITLMDDIDFASIGSVDILKGPSGYLYGLAIAGAINLQTIKPEKGKISIGQHSMFGSYGLQRYTSSIQTGAERASILVNYGKQLYDGFTPHTASEKDFVNLFGEFTPNEKQTISTYVGYSNSYDERNGELTIGQYDTLDYSGNKSYIKNNAHSNVISFRAGTSHTYKFRKNIANTTSLFGTGLNSNVSSAGGWTDKAPVNYGLRSVFNTKFSFGEKFNLSGITGVEMQRQNAQTIGYAMVADSSNITGYNIIGAIRSNQYTISKTGTLFTEWTFNFPYEISLVTGVGVSEMQIELNDRLFVSTNNNPSNPNATNNPTKYKASYKNMISPRFALNKVISKQVSFYASYSKGYKAPVSSYFFIPLTGQVNTSLKPEKGNQIEIGTKGVLLKDKLAYEITVFNTVFLDKMTVIAVPNATNTATSYTYMANGGKLNNTGIEASVKYSIFQSDGGIIKLLRPFVNMTYSNFKYEDFKFQQLSTDKKSVVETDYSNKKVAGVPPMVINSGIDFVTKLGLYANVTYSYREGFYFTSDNLNKASGYNLLNGKFGFQKTFFNHLSVDAYFGAINMTGIKYYQMVFINQLPDAYLPASNEINYFGGISLKYNFKTTD